MPLIVGLLFGLVTAVGWVDYLTGLELSVSLLYLIPITIGTSVAGRSLGNMLALASAGVWLGADFLARHTYGHWILPVWNTLTLAISFLVVAAPARVIAGSQRRFGAHCGPPHQGAPGRER